MPRVFIQQKLAAYVLFTMLGIGSIILKKIVVLFASVDRIICTLLTECK